MAEEAKLDKNGKTDNTNFDRVNTPNCFKKVVEHVSTLFQPKLSPWF